MPTPGRSRRASTPSPTEIPARSWSSTGPCSIRAAAASRRIGHPAARRRRADVDGAHGAQGRRRHRARAGARGGRSARAVGDLVTVDLDWPRRYALMRTHTALHALCGVVWRDYGAQATGGNMEPACRPDGLRVRADVRRPRRRDRGTRELTSWPRSATSGSNVRPGGEAYAIPDLIRTKINLLPEGIDEIRTIEIVGLDLQADGGTHVANTREVGGIRVTGYESRAASTSGSGSSWSTRWTDASPRRRGRRSGH